MRAKRIHCASQGLAVTGDFGLSSGRDWEASFVDESVAASWLTFHESLGGIFGSVEDAGRIGMPKEDSMIYFFWSARKNLCVPLLPQVALHVSAECFDFGCLGG